MTRRLFRTLIYMLVAGQVLMSAPVVAAVSTGGGSAAEMPCADSMPQADDSQPCPCCPDGVMGAAACLSSCTASVAPVSIFTVPQVEASPVLALTTLVLPRAISADPPIKPPPID